MAISVVQSSPLKQVDADATDFTANAASNFTAGNTVLVPLAHYAGSATVTGVTVNGQAATRDTPATANGSTRGEIWRRANVTGGAATVVVTYSGGADNYLSFNILETSPLELDTGTQNGATGTGNSPAVSTAGATSVAETLVVSLVAEGDSAAPSFTGGLTNLLWAENDGSAHVAGRATYSIETTTGTKTATYGATNTPPWVAVIAAYKDAAGGGDTTAPVLSSPTGAATGSSTATVGATTDEGNGTLFAVVTSSSTQPSIAQIKAGQDHTGAAAAWGGSVAVSSTGAKTLNATGLAPTTAYYAHVVHTDSAANDSNRVSSAVFTTFQRAAPTSDVAAGSWTPSSGTDLFAMLDEASPSDADYIKTGAAADVCTVALGTLSDPAVSTGHQVSYRISGDGVSGIQVELLQSTTVIATWTHDPAPGSPTTFTQTLTGTQADSITNYAALRLRFTEI